MIEKGFTLVELIVVIAIIAILAAVIAPNAFRAIEKAKCAQAVKDAKTIRTAAAEYYADTGQWPPVYRLTTPINPFLTNPPVTGWAGPYLDKWKPHPWSGHIGWDATLDLDANGKADGCVVYDDDQPGTSASNNAGRIPRKSMENIDLVLDDGNLSRGMVQGDGLGLLSAAGELVIMVIHDNNG
ncbi:MAG TPA: prepilin-type N-terminal cleavage/methylation domain-containing protein [Candidatus Omnitrophota bacterium]|nr:prepilin-type N-terminal cleavage/methylation domain-containing protein [Candidatus Omnitrophota bacterium]HRZ15774.1 prepilin-type N-terminal cleavage/methylation domain-containing protein [Candidatus Omnitrophota bacterium]